MVNDWADFKLSEVINLIGGGTPKRSIAEYWGGDIPWLSVKDFNNEYRHVEKSDETITKLGLEKSSTKLLERGQIIISARGTVGELAQVSKTMAFNQSCYGIDAKTEYTLNDFLYYLLKHSISNIQRITHGAVFDTITRDTFSFIEVSLPPLPEQKAIAHILGSLDDKIELNRQMNETLEAMAQALFKSWFVNFDPVIDNALAAGNAIPDEFFERAELRKGIEKKDNSDIQSLFPDEFEFTEEMGWIPRGWMVESFGDVSICFDRLRIPLSKKQRESKKPGVIPYHGATSVMDYINEWILDDIYLLIGEDGSVIKEDGSPFVQYIWGKTWVNNHAHVLQGKNGVGTEHLMLFMQSQNLTAYITGAVQLKINQGNMNRIPFLNSGSKINEKFTAIINPYYEKVRITAEENETLVKLRDTLLPKLMSGELRITDAEALMENV